MNIGYCLQGQPLSQTAIQLEMKELSNRGHNVGVIDIEIPLDGKFIKNCDFIMCHFAYQGIWAKRWGIPYAVYPHAYDIWKDNGKALKYAISSKNCKWVACESKFHRQKFEEWEIEKPLQLVYGAIDVDFFKRKSKKLGDKVVAGGRLKPKKGLEYAVRGYKDIHIFGKGQTMLDKLQSINPNLRYHGVVSKEKYRSLLEDAYLFVSPNIIAKDGDMDGIPATIMEAMLMELQVLTTPISGIPELSPHVILEDPETIATGNVEIPNKRNTSGRDFIRKNNSPKVVVDRIIDGIEKYT